MYKSNEKINFETFVSQPVCVEKIGAVRDVCAFPVRRARVYSCTPTRVTRSNVKRLNVRNIAYE